MEAKYSAQYLRKDLQRILISVIINALILASFFYFQQVNQSSQLKPNSLKLLNRNEVVGTSSRFFRRHQLTSMSSPTVI